MDEETIQQDETAVFQPSEDNIADTLEKAISCYHWLSNEKQEFGPMSGYDPRTNIVLFMFYGDEQLKDDLLMFLDDKMPKKDEENE